MNTRLELKCENSLEGIFTAIYDGFVYRKERGDSYEDEISITIGDGGDYKLFTEVIEIVTDPVKAQKTIGAIQKQLGFYVYSKIFHALCHFDEDRATVVFGYLVRAFQVGARINEYMTDPYVMRVLELSRKAANENQRLMGFVRFQDNGKFLYAKIEPKCDAIPLMMDHFIDRYPNENFVIYDEKREYALVHPAHQKAFFVEGDEWRMADLDDPFEKLWKAYFITMEIAERHNEKCQMNLMPKWYRKNMLEQEAYVKS